MQSAPPLPTAPIAIPPTSELFTKHQIIERHSHLLNGSRVTWALRNRESNGLAPYVYEARSGELLINEPGFLRWFLGLGGRSKPRTLRGRGERASAP